MLGHADVKTTKVYTRGSIRAPKDIHTATHPAGMRQTELQMVGDEGGEPWRVGRPEVGELSGRGRTGLKLTKDDHLEDGAKVK
jgi:hypothetical protein